MDETTKEILKFVVVIGALPWVLPFLNLYGFYGQIESNTKTKITVPDPRPGNRPDLTVELPTQLDGETWGGGIVLALTVAAQLFIKVKGYFGVDEWLGFGAVYGFGCCLAMVLFAKALGFLLKRPDDYYTQDDDDA